MPKLKVKKSIRKRFKLTGTGKIFYRRAGKSHLLQGKSRKRKRAFNRWDELSNKPMATKMRAHLL
jgi:ribosomal protein L35